MSAPSVPTLPRRFDPAEAFFWFLDHGSSMNFAVIAEGAGSLNDADVREALARAQQAHPLLQAGVATDAQHRLMWVPAPDQPIDYQALSTGPEWRTPLAEAMAQPFLPEHAPLVRALRLNQEDERWVLALIFHHSAGDGRSGCRLLSEVLLNIADPNRLAVSHPGHPPLHAHYPPAYVGAAGQAALQAFKAQRKEELQRYGQFDELPGFTRRAPAQQPRFRTLRLAEASRLAQRCRAHQATMQGAISAAQLLALHRAFGDAEPRTLGLTTPADLRAHLSRPLDEETPLLCATLITGAYRLEPATDFWALARSVSSDLKRQMQRGDGHLFYGLFPPLAEFPATPDGIAAFLRGLENAPQVSLVSNVGRVGPPPALGRLRIAAMSFALCPMSNHLLFNAVSTFDEQLTLNVNFDAARLPTEQAETIIADLATALAKAAD